MLKPGEELIVVDHESKVEEYFREQVELHGGQSYKLSSPGMRGIPDRLVIFPFNRFFFVELKQRKSGRIKHHQWEFAKAVLEVGVLVHFIWSFKEVDQFIKGAV